MSLIYNIKTRRFEDLINQGLRLALTDSTSNAVVDGVLDLSDGIKKFFEDRMNKQVPAQES